MERGCTIIADLFSRSDQENVDKMLSPQLYL